MNNKNSIKERIFKSVYGEIEEKFEKDVCTFEKDRKEFEMVALGKISEVEVLNKETEEGLDQIKEELEKDLVLLEFKINKAVEKLRGALLAERNTTSLIYSNIVEIDEQRVNKETTTTIIRDNIAFGISADKLDTSYITPLSLENLIFKNLEVKKINKRKNLNGTVDTLSELNSFTIKNKNHNSVPFEFSIDFKGRVGDTSLLILDLQSPAILEIYINNNLQYDKRLSNYFSIPVDNSVQSLTIRSYPTLHKSSDLNFKTIGVSSLIYQDKSVFESKLLPINETLSQLVLDTCDNSNKKDVNIDYYISINEGVYERVNPTTKNSNKYNNNVQSIIKLSKDVELELIEATGIKKAEGDIRYTLPNHLQNFLEYETTVYVKNENEYTLLNNSVYVVVKEDIVFNLSSFSITDISKVKVDGKQVEGDDILLLKGIRKIEWGDRESINYNYLETIIGLSLIFKNKITVPVHKTTLLNNSGTEKYISLSTPELQELTRSDEMPSLYFKNLNQQITVRTLKVKAELHSLNNQTVPYISRILVRGI